MSAPSYYLRRISKGGGQKEMRRSLRVLKFAVVAALIVTVLSFVVMRLWNWLTPALFGWHVITFWQALGILILSKILFGGFRGRPSPRMYWRRRMMERWAQMTPEEREKFRESMRERCGPSGVPKPDQKA
jgi:Ca2+/H+ antiporter, TMEM165/GDT1 family